MERRIGERRRVEAVVVRWRSAEARRGFAARFRGPVGGEVVLDNLSVTGAGFIGPVDNGMTMNLHLEVELGGEWGLVQLARIRPSNSPGQKYYGVAFLSQEPLFMEQVGILLGGIEPLTGPVWR